jgi:NTP pyrophosphatase (non-canonical NTP hydrolase)
MIKKRGFEKETIQDVSILFIEEIGELFKALRNFIGIKVDKSRLKEYKNVDIEIADCLIYLTDIANLMNIDMEEAIKKKASQDMLRKWA